jgi:hypothetical protein
MTLGRDVLQPHRMVLDFETGRLLVRASNFEAPIKTRQGPLE